jgi:hypothetical protein
LEDFVVVVVRLGLLDDEVLHELHHVLDENVTLIHFLRERKKGLCLRDFFCDVAISEWYCVMSWLFIG